MKKVVREALSMAQIDVDMKNAHPTFICDILEDQCPEAIIHCVDNRDDMLKDCMAATGLSRDLVKPLFNVTLYSADDWKLSWWERKHKPITEPFRSKFMKYTNACHEARRLILDSYPAFVEIAKATCAKKKSTNMTGSTLSHLLQTIEDIALEATRCLFHRTEDHQRQRLYEIAALIFDRLQMRPVNDLALRRMKKDIDDATRHICNLFK